MLVIVVVAMLMVGEDEGTSVMMKMLLVFCERGRCMSRVRGLVHRKRGVAKDKRKREQALQPRLQALGSIEGHHDAWLRLGAVRTKPLAEPGGGALRAKDQQGSRRSLGSKPPLP